MHPELFTLPGGLSIKTYGFCLMVGFLTAVWLAMRRAQRVKVNPDTVLDMSFLALVFGVGGARAFYVVHYWPEFAGRNNTLLAMLDIPVPKDMDGKVMLDIFRQALQVHYTEAKETTAPTKDAGYSAEEEEQIQQHLADLGYMD